MLYLTSGSGGIHLLYKLSREFNLSVIPIEYKKFPDGEKYLRLLEEVNSKRIALIQSMYRQPDEHLIEYLFLVSTLKELGAKEVIGVIPYFPYARQDSRFNPGEVVSLRVVVELIEKIGTDRLITIDMHLHRYKSVQELFKIPATNLSAMKELARYVRNHYPLDNVVVIGPDEESEQWAKIVANELNCEYDVLQKKRISAEEVVLEPREVKVKGKDVVIVDDIISTGGTLAKAISFLKEQGARKVICIVTHAILAGDALSKIYRAGAYDIIATDTVPSTVSKVSVSKILYDELAKYK